VKLGFGLLNNLDVRASVDLARRAESAGYESIWFAEHNFSRDAITSLAAAATVTERIRIGSGVVPIFTRSALLTATTFASLDELSRGRIIFGLGAGSRVLIRAQGIQYAKPLAALREYVEACRAVWSSGGTRVSYEGEIVKLQEAELDFAPVRRRIPTWIGATGPKACELAGQIGDGILLNGFLPSAYVPQAKEHMVAGATSAERNLSDFEMGMMIVTSVADSKPEAREYLRPLVTKFLARLPDIAKHTSIWGDVWRQMVSAVREGGVEAGSRYVSDELIDDITACGTADDCRSAIERYMESGVTLPILMVFGDPLRTLEAMVPNRS
jgi:5,10-methylenetetrahydromethanopterin reductase